MSKIQLKKIIQKYAEILRKNRVAFKQIYLFGSHAAGKAKAESDIDVAVIVSRLPRGRGYLEKRMKLWVLAPEADVRIEPILLEQIDLREETLSIMGDEVREHGILVVSS